MIRSEPYPTATLVFSWFDPLGPAGRAFLPHAAPRRAIACAVTRLLSPRRCARLIHATEPLFAWGELEDHPTLVTIRDFLDAVPDQALLDGLRAARGKGLDDYPLPLLGRVVLLTIVLRPVSFNACLAELHRNPAWRRVVGIRDEGAIPQGWNLSRFLDVLGQEPHPTALRQVFDALAWRLGAAVPDLGRHTAGDATALAGRAKTDPRAARVEARQGLPQPSGGRKEYSDDEGKVAKVYEWFGYQLHLLVDVQHEVALAYHVTDAKAGDDERAPALVAQAVANLPAGWIETSAYDKAADDDGVHELLHDEQVRPVIQNRTFQLEEPEKVVGGRTPLNVVYDQAGTLYCYDRVGPTPLRHGMAYIGHEAERGTLKYRCPARHGGWDCPSDAACNGARKYGLTVRVKQEIDLRRFPSIPRATKLFERLYKGRTSVERVNGRLKIFWGIDDGQVYGSRRFHAHVGAVLIAHLGLATVLAQAERYEGTYGTMRLSPIAQALREMMKKPPEPAADPAAANG
jgi:hypothetical protein